jgi:hypothetical protein
VQEPGFEPRTLHLLILKQINSLTLDKGDNRQTSIVEIFRKLLSNKNSIIFIHFGEKKSSIDKH